jgi:hypothetical protein
VKLLRLDNGQYRIEDGSVTIEGGWGQIRAQLLYEFEIDPAQIDRAIEDMREKRNDAADFGIQGYFQFSYSTTLERKVKAELMAILDLREEAHTLSVTSKGSPMEKDAYNRLLNMYISFDAAGTLLLLGEELYADDIAA